MDYGKKILQRGERLFGGPSSLVSGRSSRVKRVEGFALLMTLTLLAFLVLLLVGLATYTRIETAVSSNMQRQGQARENALLALNVAVGQLQKYAGPDQRVTATAESLSGVDAQKIHYMGVWASTATTTSVTTTDPSTGATVETTVG